MSERKTYTATPERDDRFWLVRVPELDIATEARRLDQVEEMARDLIATWLEVDPDSFDVAVGPIDLSDDLGRYVALVNRARADAETRQALAQAATHSIAKYLHRQGMPVRDIGQLLEISYQRAAQLVGEGTIDINEAVRLFDRLEEQLTPAPRSGGLARKVERGG